MAAGQDYEPRGGSGGRSLTLVKGRRSASRLSEAEGRRIGRTEEMDRNEGELRGLRAPENSERVRSVVREEERIYTARVEGRLRKRRRAIRLIDAFAGAGGMSLGFSSAFGHSFESVWANDFNECSVATYNRNLGGHCIGGDIVEILSDESVEIPPADVVVGGPPCQGFSLLNKNRSGDQRKQLWRPFFEVVRRCDARVFVMENVPQLLGSSEHGEILATANRLGFQCRSEILCAADYGVPQTRRRAFVIGSKDVDPGEVFPPRRTHYDPRKKHVQSSFLHGDRNGYMPGALPWRTVRDAIGDLGRPKGTSFRQESPPLDLHFGRSPTPMSLARYRAIPAEGMNRFDLQKRAPELTPGCWVRKKSGGTDLFGRLWWDRPAFTIRTEFYKPEKGRYLHPKQHRPITHREAARLQSFPDDFVFVGSKIEVARQIGNAVPPQLAARVADAVVLLLTMVRSE